LILSTAEKHGCAPTAVSGYQKTSSAPITPNPTLSTDSVRKIPFSELTPEEQAIVRAWFRFKLDVEFMGGAWEHVLIYPWLQLNLAPFDENTRPHDEYIYRLRS
jgi:hypothetical protein